MPVIAAWASGSTVDCGQALTRLHEVPNSVGPRPLESPQPTGATHCCMPPRSPGQQHVLPLHACRPPCPCLPCSVHASMLAATACTAWEAAPAPPLRYPSNASAGPRTDPPIMRAHCMHVPRTRGRHLQSTPLALAVTTLPQPQAWSGGASRRPCSVVVMGSTVITALPTETAGGVPPGTRKGRAPAGARLLLVAPTGAPVSLPVKLSTEKKAQTKEVRHGASWRHLRGGAVARWPLGAVAPSGPTCLATAPGACVQRAAGRSAECRGRVPRGMVAWARGLRGPWMTLIGVAWTRLCSGLWAVGWTGQPPEEDRTLALAHRARVLATRDISVSVSVLLHLAGVTAHTSRKAQGLPHRRIKA